jgi:polar amino acid transport system substrate-binding protein
MSNRILRLASVLTIALLALTGCDLTGGGNQATAHHDSLAEIQRTHTIIAGWAPYPPYSFLDPHTRKPSGLYLELFERVASEAGLKVQWIETTWGTMVADQQTGRFQVMAAPVFRTIPRALAVTFTRPISDFGLSAVVRSDNTRFHTLADFDRGLVKIAVTQGEVGYEFATHHLPQAKLNVFKTGDIGLAMTDVIQGRADTTIADSWTVSQFVAVHPGQVRDVFAGKPFNRVGAGWFVAHDDANLAAFLNTSVDWLISSGVAKQVGEKYGVPVEER